MMHRKDEISDLEIDMAKALSFAMSKYTLYASDTETQLRLLFNGMGTWRVEKDGEIHKQGELLPIMIEYKRLGGTFL